VDVAELERALRRPEAWGARVDLVDVLETHISLLFFAGQRVYKVKKPVDYGFLDFTTLERRKHYCEEEVRLNARLAEGVYLRVAPLFLGADGLPGLERPDAAAAPVEYAVEMRRLPAEGMLDRLLAEGQVDNAQMNALAEKLGAFHAAAATGPGVDQHGAPEAVAFNVIENFDQTRANAGPAAELQTVSLELHRFLEARARAFLEERRPLLEQRVRDGRIREGHGDLHAGNVCYLPRGVVVYDCLEFAERFRCGDVACDLAFLTMDLDHGGYRAFARYLTRRYGEHSGDDRLGELMPFYSAYRAIVRAKVAGLRAAGSTGAVREDARREAQGYFHLAASYELPPALILMCGLPAAGKTWDARAVARPFEAVVESSDIRRKLLAGLPIDAHPPSSGYDAGLYAPEMKDRVYADLLERAGQSLERGRTVVVDATFPSAARRAPFLELADRRGAPLVLVFPSVDEQETRRRMEARAADEDEASDADLAVWQRAREVFEPPDELPPGRRIDHASGVEPDLDLAGRVIDALVRQVGTP
jgi:hypothetical protein